MKRQFRMFAAVAAMVLGFAAPALASDWLRDGTTLTEQNASGTAWVLKITVANTTEISVTAVTTAGTNTELDFSGAITDANGTEYTIVSLDGFTGKPITKLVFPTGIRTTKRDAFLNCTALKTVEPLIPDTITEFGQRTFAGCTALEGDVVFPANAITSTYSWQNGTWGWFNGSQITSCDMSAATMTEIVKYSFANCPKLKWVKLPQGLTTISEFAFADSYELERIEPLLPDTVTSFGACPFFRSSALQGDVKLTNTAATVTFTHHGNNSYGVFQGCSKIASFEMTAKISHNLDGEGAIDSNMFNGCTALGSVVLPENVMTVNRGGVFSGCTSLTNIVFLGWQAPTAFTKTAFDGLTENKTRLLFPRLSPSWEAFSRTLTNYEPMSETLETAYLKLYPDAAVLPLGRFKLNQRSVWITDLLAEDAASCYVLGNPVEASAVSPTYGGYHQLANGTSYTFTADQVGTFDNGEYRCLGYELSYETALRTWSEPVKGKDASCTIDAADDKVWRLVWQWGPNGYALETTPLTEGGTVVRDPDADLYVPETEVTLTACPEAGYRFVCWVGDVPTGQGKNLTLKLTMDAAKSCRPVFAHPWRFNGSNQIGDGNWTLTVKNTAGELGVMAVASVMDDSEIDLTLPITDAEGTVYPVVSVGGFAAKGLRRVVLPNTLRRLENQAFYNCTALESVTPLLPASLVYLGQGCFNGCTSLGGDVVFPANEIESPYSWISVEASYGWFRASRITSCDMSKATVATIRSYSFNDCQQLTQVKLPNGLTTIEKRAFEGALALTSVSPLFPASVAEVGARAFYNCKLLEGDVVFPKTDGTVTFVEDGNLGASNFGNCEKITSFSLLADFYYRYNSNEPVHGRLGQYFLAGCKALKSVTISEVASDLSKSGVFSQSPALSEIVFLGETAPSIPTGGLFPNVPDYQAIVKIPSLTDSWAEFGAKWFSDPTADERAAYAALPGAVGRPKKIWKDAAKRRLFVRYLRTEGFSVIVR